VDATIDDLLPHLTSGDILIDGGNSYYVDDIRRAKELAEKGIHYVDVGPAAASGTERGYCLMIGARMRGEAPRSDLRATGARRRRHPPHSGAGGDRGTPSRDTCTAGRTARPLRQDGAQRNRVRPHGRLRRGLGILRNANVGKREHAVDAETTPLRAPEHYQYDLDLRDITEVWRRGSVIASWLLDLTQPP